MPYRTNLPAVTAKLTDARRAGLIAAATVLQNAVKRNLTGGYTSGAFVTGHVHASVTISKPDMTPFSGSIAVGTDVPYALFWEVGHHNTFTRQYERVEKWMPALLESRIAMQRAFEQEFLRMMAGM